MTPPAPLAAPAATLSPDTVLDAKLARLEQELTRLGRVVVAFSGGVDSAFLAVAAARFLGSEAAPAVTAVSPSLADAEVHDCAALAEAWGLRWSTVHTDEMERAAYRRNDADRCWHCKSALMDQLEPLAGACGATVVLGVNVDDLGDHRPGQTAASDRGAAFPLVAAGFTKAEVRAASKRWGLSTWDKPAAACLASRIPYGSAVSVQVLTRVERAEAALRALGIGGALRVRHYGDTARLEVELGILAEVLARREAVVTAVRGAGYGYVTLDLEGFRSGNLNGDLVAGS